MPLVIRYLGLPFPGREIVVPDGKETVLFGRASESEVPFPADFAAVSREHFMLRHDLGGWKFVVNREKPVLLRGRPVLDGQDLPDSAEIQLGDANGPKLKIEVRAAAETGLPKTEILSQGPIANERELLDRQHARGRATSGSIGLVLAGVAAIAVAGWFLLTQTDLIVQRAQTTVAAAGQAADEATRTAADVSARAEAVAAQLTGLKVQADQAGRGQEDKYRALIEERLASVYLVSLRTPGNEHVGTGTASVIALPDGTKALATNSHVAEMLLEVQQGGQLDGFKLVVVQPAPPYKRFEVTRVTLHPGYYAWQRFLDELFTRVQRGQARPPGYALGYDVALMYVENWQELGEPLTLASAESLESLSAGDPIFYIGYPAENLNFTDPDKPVPTSHTGIVTSVTTFSGAQGTFEQNQLVQHSAPAIGGASGSPIFNAKGEVVAYLNSGNLNLVRDVEGQMIRVPSSVLINYAQRVDLLQELERGEAEAKMPAYQAFWAEIAKAAEISSADVMDQQADAFRQAKDAAAAILVKEETAIVETPEAGAENRRARRIEADLEPGSYLAMAASSDKRNGRLVLIDKDGKIVADSPRGFPLAGFYVDIAAAGPHAFYVIDDVEDPKTDAQAATEFLFRLYRAEPKKPPQG